jgi:phosphatidylglycerophosphatase A
VNRAMRGIAWVLATWFGCGYAPWAPGTAGTLGALPVYIVVAHWGHWGVGAAALVATFVGVWASSVVARDLGRKDPQIVVIDEVAGMLVTMLPMQRLSWKALIVGFVLFRILDATKPRPVRDFERLPGGWGIVADDVAAGIAAGAILAVLRALRVLP